MNRKRILIGICLMALFTPVTSISKPRAAGSGFPSGGQAVGTQPVNAGPSPGTVRENPKDGLKYVWIPPGTFMMGCSPGDSECKDNEKPPHQVTITKGFWMGQTEVTCDAYKHFARAKRHLVGAFIRSGYEAMPYYIVKWTNAQAYCGWAGGRLPTEAEWEYAARAGSMDARYGALDEVAWYEKNSGGQIHEVGQKRANAFGLFDMLGNVWEWVNDWYDPDYYRLSPERDPRGPDSGEYRVLRGGGRSDGSIRVSTRIEFTPKKDLVSGFRCAVDVIAP